MSTNIYVHGEKKNSNGRYEAVDGRFYPGQSYAIFGWLAGIRNYSAVECLSGVTRFYSFPDQEDGDAVSLSIQEEWEYLTDYTHPYSVQVKTLNSVDYSAVVNDRRKNGQTLPEEEGTKMPLREFLGEEYFQFLKELNDKGIERIIFWFD